MDFTSKARMINATNNIPCNQPTIFTASGRSAKYFKGMAIKRRMRNEIPSEIAIVLNQRSVLFFCIVFGCREGTQIIMMVMIWTDV